MIIDFSQIEEKAMPEFKGGKKELIARMHTDENGKIMYGKLKKGASIGLHTHDTSSEIIYILSGKADFIYDDGTESVLAGGCHYCPKGHTHSMMNNCDEELIFFAVVPEQ